MKKNDIVLIPFPFTDLTGNKNRPELILIDADDDLTVCFLTTRLGWESTYDSIIDPSYGNGLKRPSLSRLSKIATIDKNLVLGKLGRLDNNYQRILDQNLIGLFQPSEKSTLH